MSGHDDGITLLFWHGQIETNWNDARLRVYRHPDENNPETTLDHLKNLR